MADKQVIVVVHGVGVRAAGESGDLLAGALAAGGPGDWRRRATDDFRIPETVPGTGRMAPSFPARLSRFRRFGGRFPAPDAPERVIADFYWGDIAGTSGSVPSTLVGLVRVMLGLVHVLRENALTVFPGDRRRDRAVRALVRGAGLAIHGPIFALNIALVFGLVGVVLGGVGAGVPTLIAVALCLGTSLALQLRARTFLLRHLGAWLGVAGVLLGLFLAAHLAGLGPPRPLDRLPVASVCSWMEAGERHQCYALYRLPPFLFGLWLQVLMVALWAWVALVALVLGLRWLGRALAGDAGADRDILMPVLALMSLLWFLLIGLAWGGVAQAYAQVSPGTVTGTLRSPEIVTDKLFATSQRGIWASLAAVAAVALAMLPALVARAGAARAVAPRAYMDAPEVYARKLRLVVPDAAKGAMLAMPAALLALIASSIWAPGDLCMLGGAHPLCRMEGQTAPVVSAGLALMVLFGAPFLPFLSRGLYIAGDVIIYLNDFWWRRAPSRAPAATFADALLPALWRNRRRLARRQDGFAFRQRIRTRLVQLVDDLIASEEPDRLDIVSHSQGTVIALDVLRRHGARWGRMANGTPRQLTLVTMGSPWRHIYHQYFPARFAVPPPLPPQVAAWTNIFRVDDFIGTHVRDTPDGEIAVGPGGHTNYWTDAEVRPHLRDHLG